jgi:hypothetical protein
VASPPPRLANPGGCELRGAVDFVKVRDVFRCRFCGSRWIDTVRPDPNIEAAPITECGKCGERLPEFESRGYGISQKQREANQQANGWWNLW